jgi:hypothetical protein
MPVSRALRRLLRVLHLEEEETRRALESALSDLHRLEHALAAAAARNRSGRGLIVQSAVTGELADRLAGLEESLAAARRTQRSLDDWHLGRLHRDEAKADAGDDSSRAPDPSRKP